MREEESNNPRILPHYQPWWLNENQIAPSYSNGGSERSRIQSDDDDDYDDNESNKHSSSSIQKEKLLGNVWVDESWKVADLKNECARRGLKPVGTKKHELIEQLLESSRLYDLSDAGMVRAVFTPHSFDKDMPCFPHIYETEADIKRLKSKIMMQPAPSPSPSPTPGPE